jgi:hypothetical protein
VVYGKTRDAVNLEMREGAEVIRCCASMHGPSRNFPKGIYYGLRPARASTIDQRIFLSFKVANKTSRTLSNTSLAHEYFTYSKVLENRAADLKMDDAVAQSQMSQLIQKLPAKDKEELQRFIKGEAQKTQIQQSSSSDKARFPIWTLC